jgi:hypothetical protein
MRAMSLACRASFVSLALGLSGIAAAQSLLDPETMPRMKPGPPVTFGTTQDSYVSVGEGEFPPANSVTTYGDVGAGGSNLLRYKTAGNTGFFANVHLPGGAVVMSVEFDMCDSSTIGGHLTAAAASTGAIDGFATILGTPVMSVSNSGNPCAAYNLDLSGLNYVVDNTANRFVLIFLPGTNDNTNSFAGAKVVYRLSVSPAPATADFADVPTSHPFFQFVEALYHSGITAGCGGGNFCPDNPLTRGQMAVFLSKALGLQFP